MNCRSTLLSTLVAGPGEPGGTLPAGTAAGQFLQFNGVLWAPSSWLLPLAVVIGEAGEVLTAIDGVAEFQTPVDNVLEYRNEGATLSAGNPWLGQWYANASFATMGAAGFAVALRTGTLKWMRVFHANPLLTSEVLTYTIVVNGVDTALSAQLDTNDMGPSNDLTSTAAVVAGDLISCRVDGVGGSRAIRAAVSFFLD